MHGIIVLVTGLWLVWRRQDEILANRQEGNPWITAAILAVAVPFMSPAALLNSSVSKLARCCWHWSPWPTNIGA